MVDRVGRYQKPVFVLIEADCVGGEPTALAKRVSFARELWPLTTDIGFCVIA